MKKNRLVAILLASAMVFGVAGCGDSKESKDSTEVVASGEEKLEVDEGLEGTELSESTEEEETNDFNYDDEHIKAVQKFLENQSYYGYSGTVSENDNVMIEASENYDFNTHIVEDTSDYTGYRDALKSNGYSDEDLGTNQTKFHSYIDCENQIFVEIDNKGDWVLNEANQANVDFKTGMNYTNAWELWVSTMVSSALYFDGGTWSEDGNNVVYTQEFDKEDSKEVVTMTFETQKDSSLKPVEFTSSVTTTQSNEGYNVDESGNVSDEKTTTTTASKNKTYMVYNYDNHKLKLPKYKVVKDEESVDDTEVEESMKQSSDN